MKNDKRNGYAISFYFDGGRFEGNIRKGYAKEYCCNGDWYEGEIKNDMYNGFGIYNFSNGDRLEGEWKDWMDNGNGIFYSSLGFEIKRYFKLSKFEKIFLLIHEILLFLNHLYSIILRKKISILFIIN